MPAKIEIAAKRIFSALKQTPILTHSDLQKLFTTHRDTWGLPANLSFRKFVDFVTEKGKLKKYRLEFPRRPVTRYCWGDVAVTEIVQSISPAGYFSHFTAMQFHELTEQAPKTIYFNIEQRLTGGAGTPEQPAIDRVFKGKCRVTKNSASIGDRVIRIVNGRNTGQLGVLNVAQGMRQNERVTDLERTLIDITVRPIYSGGIYLVAQAFAKAGHEVSIDRLVHYLRQLNFTYPYHQAIGYYLERTEAFDPPELMPLKDMGLHVDFYLDYGLKKTDYIESWRLYVPQGF